MNKFAALWLCCAMITGALLFQTSQHVTDGRQRLENITADMRREEDTLRVLQAEWSYLNQPERLEKLSAQYLKLAPMKGRQFVAAADLPARSIPPAAAPENIAADISPENITAAALGAAAAQNVASIETAAAAETADIPAAVAMPLRKPAGLRLPAAYTPPQAAGGSLKPAAPKPAQPAPKAAAAENAARRNFLDVLDSLGSGGTR